jgi:signal transduction histidine kinase
MLPRGLTGRILLAFVALAVAMVLALGGTLFLVLRELHASEIRDSLTRQVSVVLATMAREPASQWDSTLQDLGQSMADDDGFILIQAPNGAIRVVAGNPSSLSMPPAPAQPNLVSSGTIKTSDGQQYIYVERNAAATRGRNVLFAMPDRSAQLAAADLTRALLIVLLILLAAGIPIAWLLSRSLTRPMHRLADAAAGLATGSEIAAPLPLQGPTEVRVLTERFNEMARELTSTRAEETKMLANLRHDLRTPLTSIAGFAEAIADGTATGDAAVAAARTISGEAERLERLVGEIGVVERLRQGPAALRPEALDGQELLAGAAARFEGRAAGQGVTLEVAGPAAGAAPPRLTGDRLAVERVLQNLLDNALSVLSSGGHVWLRAVGQQLPGRGAGVSLSVTDDGPGFPPGTLEHVFERFYRADPARSGGGSGLGLAIVREMARAHGGEAWAENVAPHGARVTVFLPQTPVVPGVTGSDPGIG